MLIHKKLGFLGGSYGGFMTMAAMTAALDEGHGFVKKENEIKGYWQILTFLDKYLKEKTTD